MGLRMRGRGAAHLATYPAANRVPNQHQLRLSLVQSHAIFLLQLIQKCDLVFDLFPQGRDAVRGERARCMFRRVPEVAQRVDDGRCGREGGL